MRSYLLDCFESEENIEHLTPDQKFIYIYNRFTSEYVHQYNLIKYNFNETLIMREWLLGLAISCDFYNYDIIKVAKEHHDLDPEHQFSEKLKNKIGDIIMITSICGYYPYPGGGNYTAAKRAEIAFSETLRMEMAGKM